jgi:RNA polymerase sigma-70 factor (ECF subfamily)
MTSGTTTSGPADLAIADVQWLGRLARRLAEDADDADDLAQETLVAAWSQPTERNEDARRPWLVAVLRNRLRMLRRSQGRRVAREHAVEAQSPTREPDAELERLEMLRWVLAELEALAPEDRIIIVRRFFDGEDAAEIGRALAMPAATVRSRIHRSLQRLRSRLDQRFGDRRTWCAALGLVPKVGGEQAASTTGDTTMSTTTFMAKGLIACSIAVAVGGVAWATTRAAPKGERTSEIEAGEAVATDARTARVAENRRSWEDRRARIRAAIPRGAMPIAPAPRTTDDGYRSRVNACLEDLESTASGALTLQVTEIGAPDVGIIYDEVVVVEETIDDEDVLTCITESMYAFVGEAPTESYERMSQRTMQIGDSKEPDVVGQRMFDAIVGAHISEVRFCQTKVAEGEANGTLDVAITVGEDQLAAKVEVVDSTLPAPVQTCIVAAMQRWRYPKPIIGKTFEYGYALPLAGK